MVYESWDQVKEAFRDRPGEGVFTSVGGAAVALLRVPLSLVVWLGRLVWKGAGPLLGVMVGLVGAGLAQLLSEAMPLLALLVGGISISAGVIIIVVSFAKWIQRDERL